MIIKYPYSFFNKLNICNNNYNNKLLLIFINKYKKLLININPINKNIGRSIKYNYNTSLDNIYLVFIYILNALK